MDKEISPTPTLISKMVPKKGSSKKNDMFKSRETRPSDFKPGLYKPIIPTSTNPIPGRQNEFEYSPSGIVEVGRSIARVLEPVADRFRNGAVDHRQLDDCMVRMSYIVACKKLAYACDPESKQQYMSNLTIFIKMEIGCPAPLKAVSEGIGYFELNGTKFRPYEVPFEAFNSYAHAVGEPGGNALPELLNDSDFIVNMNYARWSLFILNRASRNYNNWAESTNRTIEIGGIEMYAPKVRVGFQPLLLMLGQEGVPPQIFVQIQIAAFVEQRRLDPLFPNPNDVEVLRHFGIVLVDWRREVQEQLFANYLHTYQLPVGSLLPHLFVYEERLKTMESTGRPWQLMSAVTPQATVMAHPFDIPAMDIEMGIIMGNKTNFKIDSFQLETASHVVGNVARDIYVRSHLINQIHI